MSPTRPSLPEAFRLDLRTQQLLLGGEAVAIRPKTWAVLRRLAGHPGALVTKEELLDAAWPDTAVGEGVLNKSIAELRAILGDDRSTPVFIETVPRRGFRWIAGDAFAVDEGTPAGGAPVAAVSAPLVVGRESELESLERSFARAAGGTRQVVFVTGEAGAGKSRLVDAFAAGLDGKRIASRSAHGQCIEAYGQHEPYRPLLEALERLARRADCGADILAALRSNAPGWLRQMPALGVPAAGLETDDGMTPGRMLRQLAAALEEISRDVPLVLVLEDAHWADLATIDACNLLARRRDHAKLLLVVTLRTADALVAQHPVLAAKTELTSRALATEIAVAPFTPASVQEYLAERCGGLQLDAELAEWIHHQTAGNPLFVRILVDDLVQRALLASDDDGRWRLAGTPGELRDFVPDSLRALVEGQVDRLEDLERDVIEAAAVMQSDFSAATLATVAGIAPERVEEACEGFVRRRQILKRGGRGGETQHGGRFAFVHSMLQRILHERLPSARLRRLHLAAAAELEREHRGREEAVALQLAMHYAMAGDPALALAQLQRAAASIQRIPAPREVIVIREQILDLVERSPALPGHRRQRVVATMDLAEARQLAYAVVDAETKALCERVLQLGVSAEDGRERFLATMGLFSNRFYTGRYAEARDIGRSLLVAAERFGHPFMIKSAQFAIAGAAYRLGSFPEAREHFEAGLRHEAASQQTYGWDFHSMSLSHLAVLAVHAGRPDEARRLVREADEHGRRDGGKPDAAVIPLFAYALAMQRDDDEATVHVERALAQSDRLGAAAWIERARFVHGLLLSRAGQIDEGLRLMTESLARQARNNVQLDRSAYCCLLADEMLRRGLDGARPLVDEGFAYMELSGERHFEPELHRLRGQLRAAAGDREGAEADLRDAREKHATVVASLA